MKQKFRKRAFAIVSSSSDSTSSSSNSSDEEDVPLADIAKEVQEETEATKRRAEEKARRRAAMDAARARPLDAKESAYVSKAKKRRRKDEKADKVVDWDRDPSPERRKKIPAGMKKFFDDEAPEGEEDDSASKEEEAEADAKAVVPQVAKLSNAELEEGQDEDDAEIVDGGADVDNEDQSFAVFITRAVDAIDASGGDARFEGMFTEKGAKDGMKALYEHMYEPSEREAHTHEQKLEIFAQFQRIWKDPAASSELQSAVQGALQSSSSDSDSF